jgi:prepilin-type N-terminal cleavage/methylation domain-containing protein
LTGLESKPGAAFLFQPRPKPAEYKTGMFFTLNHSRPRRARAFTLVELMIVVAIIALLAAIAIPYYVRSRANAQANACINNLRQVEYAALQIAFEKKLAAGTLITYPSEVTNYVKLNSAGSVPACPAGGTYSLLPVGTTPQAQCSVGTSATPPHVQ